MEKATFTVWIEEATASDMADNLERIAGMLREGYLSGDTSPRGWWNVENLTDDDDD